MSELRVSDRVFGLMFGGVFAVVAAVSWFGFGHPIYWAAVTSAFFLLIAFIVPGFLLPLNRLWSLVARRLAVAFNFLLLGTFFYVVILPFGLVSKLFGKDFMARSLDVECDSYWTPVERQASPDTYDDMF